jgi:hypothetical protein
MQGKTKKPQRQANSKPKKRSEAWGFFWIGVETLVCWALSVLAFYHGFLWYGFVAFMMGALIVTLAVTDRNWKKGRRKAKAKKIP